MDLAEGQPKVSAEVGQGFAELGQKNENLGQIYFFP